MKIRIAAVLVIFALSTVAFAHNGVEHVMGTVVKTSSNTIDVKTVKGDTKQVMFNDKTNFTKGGEKIKASDLKAGDRVVVNGEPMKEMKGMLNAVSVKVGSGAAKVKTAKHHTHSH